MKNRCITLFVVILLASCQSAMQRQKAPEATAVNKFSDPTLQQIYTLQDRRNTQELLPYLQHARPGYRRETALAFASVQDTLAIPALLGLLTDTTMAVRQAAAYALGQIGHKKASNGLYQHIKQEKAPYVQATLLEALGKVIPATDISLLVSFSAPEPASMAGQAWGIYRAGLRQVHSPQGIEKAVQFLEPDRPYEVRLAAAHFLARTPRIDLHAYRKQLLNIATADAAPEVRMAVTQALAKVNAQDKARFLSGIAQSDPDYRVRLSAIRSMAGLEFNPVSEALVAGLTDENINVAVATAEFLQANHRTANLTVLQQILNKIQDGRVRAGVLWVILRNSPLRERFGTQVKSYYANSPSPYDKGHFLKALAADYNNYKFIEEQTFSTDVPVIATYGLEALVTMRQQSDFPKELESEFARIFKKAIASTDVALVGLAAGILRDPKLNFRLVYRDFNFLVQAQQKLVLPRDMETNIELQKTIDYLQNRTAQEPPQNPFTHPIDWATVSTIPAEQQAVISTAKGDITLQLFVEDAPGSVANFVQLTRQRFFNDLYFHRVVPNFVAQGGDKRGDGWGSSDYSIRSEFAPLSYREGYVGMASAGKDTESNQWFITHSPAPHLDGRYTIFAKVISGMEVVHQLKVGDKILTVELK